MLPSMSDRTHTPVTSTTTTCVLNKRLSITKSITSSISNTKKKRKLSNSSSMSNSNDQYTGAMSDVSVSIERNDIDDIFGDV